MGTQLKDALQAALDKDAMTVVRWDPTWLDSAVDKEVKGVADESTQEDASLASVTRDWRAKFMTMSTRALIYQRFGGNIDNAMFHAERAVHLYNNPPKWADELWTIRKFHLDRASRKGFR